MAKLVVRSVNETFLELDDADSALYSINHIYEPEFHQSEYVDICNKIEAEKGSYKLAESENLVVEIHRGLQPAYADDDTDISTLNWQGMVKADGTSVSDKTSNICALKSVCVRAGYIDFETARSVTREFYKKNKLRAGVQKNDVLINSTGDGTIGRVAVYNYDFPAVVDGHITILRFDDPDIAWYVGAFLMSDLGQKQIVRYINGSSGQVEIYPQDIGRIWIRKPTSAKIKSVASEFRRACEKYDAFKKEIKMALNGVFTK